MKAAEKSAANTAGKVLAKDFKEWAKCRYKNQRPTFKQYLSDVSKSTTWRTDWFDKFMGAVEKSFDKHIKEDISFEPQKTTSKLTPYGVSARMDQRAERAGSKAPKMGSGYYASVFDQPHADVNHVLKIGKMADVDGDGYVNFLKKIINTHNPYFPQINEVKVFTGPRNRVGGYKVRLELLDNLGSLTMPELTHIAQRMFDQPARLNTTQRIVDYLDTAVEDGDVGGIADPALKEAIMIMHQLYEGGFSNDLGLSNIMVRRTKFGPQLVFTDPFAEA